MHKALKEAFRTIPPDKVNEDSEALRKFKETINIPNVNNEKWLLMPRKYTRNSARFSLPINTHDLATITPFEYVSRHVWVSNYRKELYNYVFTKYLPEPIDPEAVNNIKGVSVDVIDGDPKPIPFDKERTISFDILESALKDVLGFHGTVEKINEIKSMLLVNAETNGKINFRSWCGVVAFGERFLNSLSHIEDPCDEVLYIFYW